MLLSYKNNYPIRVFRSSICKKFAPFKKKIHKTKAAVYRYDGLYKINYYEKHKDNATGESYFLFHMSLAGSNPRITDGIDDECHIQASLGLLEMRKSKLHLLKGIDDDCQFLASIVLQKMKKDSLIKAAMTLEDIKKQRLYIKSKCANDDFDGDCKIQATIGLLDLRKSKTCAKSVKIDRDCKVQATIGLLDLRKSTGRTF